MTLEPHLSSEGTYMFNNIKQKVYANVPKGPLNNCVDQESRNFFARGRHELLHKSSTAGHLT